MPPLKKKLIGILILVAVSFAVFLPVTTFDYTAIDDALHITLNPRILHPTIAHLGTFWSAPFERLYIPVSYTAWWTISRIFSINNPGVIPPPPELFHTLNLFIHILNGILVFLVLSKAIRHIPAACFGALFFLLHPLQVESVAWISEFRGLLAALFSFAAILASQHAMDDTSRYPRKALGFATLLYIAALFSKPSAVVLPAFLLILAVVQSPKKIKLFGLVSAIWAACIIPVLLITRTEQSPGDIAQIIPFVNRPFLVLDSMGFYIQKLFAPINLCVDYGRKPQLVLDSGLWIETAATLLATSGAALLLYRRNIRWALPGLFIFLAGFAPVSGIIPFSFQSFSGVADRYAYLSIFGISLLVAELFSTLRLPLAIALGGATTLLLGGVSHEQTWSWKNGRTMYEHVLTVNQSSTSALCILGSKYEAEHKDTIARMLYERAIETHPEESAGWSHLAAYFYNKKSPESASRLARHAMSLDRMNEQAYTTLGKTLRDSARTKEARALFNAALSVTRNPAPCYIDIAELFLKDSLVDSARAYSTQALFYSTGLSITHRDLAIMFEKNTLFDSALAHYSAAAALTDTLSEIYENRSRLFLKMHQPDRALGDVEKLCSLHPGNRDYTSKVRFLKTIIAMSDTLKRDSLLDRISNVE